MTTQQNDTDLIARLYPNDAPGIKTAFTTIQDRRNRLCYVEPQFTAEEDTPPPPPSPAQRALRQEEATEDCNGLNFCPFLELRFSHGPRAPYGFVFGTDPVTCDVVLPRKRGVSARHCALTFERDFEDCHHHYRPVLRDLGSTHGTAVTYDGEGGLRQRNFRWILGGHPVPDGSRHITVEIVPGLRFRLVMARLDITCPAYAARVERFLGQAAGPGRNPLPSGVCLSGTDRPEPGALVAEANRSPSGAIRLRCGEVGRGAFGIVTKIWDVSTGAYYAAKEVVRGETREETLERIADMKAEMKTLRSLQHVSDPTSPASLPPNPAHTLVVMRR